MTLIGITAAGIFACVAAATSFSLADEQRSQRFKSLARVRDQDIID